MFRIYIQNMNDSQPKLKELRPNISASSIRTYNSLLKSMYYKFHDKGTPINIDWFKKSGVILELLKDKTPQTRKTNLAAIIVLLDGKDCDKYVEVMNGDADTTATENKKQEKTDKQAANWMDWGEVKKVWDDMYMKIRPVLNSKTAPDSRQLNDLVRFMVLTLSSGIFFPPRRSEWVFMKIKEVDKEVDNWIDSKKNEFVFNTYKTKKSLGTARVAFPKEFKTILGKYLKKLPEEQEYLIFNTKGGRLSNAALTQMLNVMFGKKIGTSMLRHIFLSDKFKDVPKLTELEETARELGHSVGQMMEYVKH